MCNFLFHVTDWILRTSCDSVLRYRLQGAESICGLTSIGNPIEEIKRSYDCLISTMVRWHLYIWIRVQNSIAYETWMAPVMTWCRQRASYYINQCWHGSLFLYVITRSHWVNNCLISHRLTAKISFGGGVTPNTIFTLTWWFYRFQCISFLRSHDGLMINRWYADEMPLICYISVQMAFWGGV